MRKLKNYKLLQENFSKLINTEFYLNIQISLNTIIFVEKDESSAFVGYKY